MGISGWRDTEAMELLTDAITYKALNYSRVICSMEADGIGLRYSPAAVYLVKELEESGGELGSEELDRLVSETLGAGTETRIRKVV